MKWDNESIQYKYDSIILLPFLLIEKVVVVEYLPQLLQSWQEGFLDLNTRSNVHGGGEPDSDNARANEGIG